ncbi:MAG: alcohol dehydrogenase catalytic domain-containing protein [Verrucomicrobia bacterium]|jgi:threonine dehydrogenase-like Zn-dependent dehydrogenase|nr:alcohol dehydrogenase catalytic domain-containing protein [Verrucomicrobiota bacterium]
MKAAYVKAPFHFEVRDVSLRDIKPDEVLVKVMACGVCGHDMILAGGAADKIQPFGHEIAGVIERVGALVRHVAPGDKVVLESGTFDRFSAHSRNGRVDLDNKGPNFWLKDNDTMGFAERIIVPMETCVKFDGISFAAASLVEPLGVAVDLVKTADIRLNNDVLVIGLGPIGLMALRLARALGARKVYGAELSVAQARCALARRWGADAIIHPDREKLTEYAFARGGVDRVLVTAPPKTIPDAIKVSNVGGIIAFLGIDYGPEGQVTFDSNIFHVNKLQLRSSFASPALFFPECLDLIQAGIVNTAELVTSTFALDGLAEGIRHFRDDRANAIKAVMVAGEAAR